MTKIHCKTTGGQIGPNLPRWLFSFTYFFSFFLLFMTNVDTASVSVVEPDSWLEMHCTWPPTATLHLAFIHTNSRKSNRQLNIKIWKNLTTPRPLCVIYLISLQQEINTTIRQALMCRNTSVALSSSEDYFSNFINSALYSRAADSDHCPGPGHAHLHPHPPFVQTTPESRRLWQTTLRPKRLLIPALCFVK